MKATIISTPSDIPKIKTEAVIVSFRPSFNDVLAIANKKVKVIEVKNDTNNSLSDNSRNMIYNFGIVRRV